MSREGLYWDLLLFESLLPTRAFIVENLLRHYAQCAFKHVKLQDHKWWAVWLAKILKATWQLLFLWTIVPISRERKLLGKISRRPFDSSYVNDEMMIVIIMLLLSRLCCTRCPSTAFWPLWAAACWPSTSTPPGCTPCGPPSECPPGPGQTRWSLKRTLPKLKFNNHGGPY